MMQTIHQTIIEPKKGWQLIDWRELREYRDLFYFLVLRDIKVLYKQTILGFAWAIIQPLFSMVIFSIVFGQLAGVSTDGAPKAIFYYTALVPWTYFSNAMSGSTQSLISNANMLSKIYFPRLVIPMTPVLAKLVDFAIAFAIVVVLLLWYQIMPTVDVWVLPVLIMLMVGAAAGIGMWLSALAIQYRDVRFAIQFLTQFLMYAAPVVWPVSLIPAQYRLLYGLYPMAGVIEGFRAALIGTTPMPWDLIGMGTVSTVVLLLSGAFYFRRMERIFADVA
ncbi:MAG: ABC transporter permease [Caldilineaceae bacterium]